MQNDKISLQNFALLSVIGKGSYAKVVLVKKLVVNKPEDIIYIEGN
jgi:hypothetical protein